ncbi:hypothetical protein BDZ90DRAFT_229259 [Jaminaea rosea]|uniref:Uncharacterized protein n=1 Tax=Jaminaea rosea TaxID=1569628 RepID=A0A316V120_9BASI|nr:hypothetical protein BDZ90DRAFT_229259 [Jaminaea rosea]PWN30241.1 hypothetical protein BDZ90DRAFT_229259 [Jaminaea rosea]
MASSTNNDTASSGDNKGARQPLLLPGPSTSWPPLDPVFKEMLYAMDARGLEISDFCDVLYKDEDRISAMFVGHLQPSTEEVLKIAALLELLGDRLNAKITAYWRKVNETLPRA